MSRCLSPFPLDLEIKLLVVGNVPKMEKSLSQIYGKELLKSKAQSVKKIKGNPQHTF